MSRSILDQLDTVAVLAGGLFAGTAFYMSFGQAPALRAFGLNEHWKFFPYMYQNIASQPVFALVAGTAGIAHGIRILGAPFYRNLWIISGSTFLAIFPFTFGLLRPINRKIIDDNKRVKSGEESQINLATKKELLDKWVALHLIRTVISIAGFGGMVYGLSRHSSFVFGW
jgi:hypothetical protein